jgi:hypothetical protein
VTEWIQENPENMREYMAQRKLQWLPWNISVQMKKQL